MAGIYSVLEKAGNEKTGCLSHLKRSLDLHLGMEHVSNTARKEWFAKNTPRACEDAFEGMHLALGGDLFMDGKLCYRNGDCIRQSFNKWNDEGEPVHSKKV